MRLTDALVTNAMSKQGFSCGPDDDISRAKQLMRERQVRRLAVVDNERRLISIVSLNDIAREGQREESGHAARQVTDAEIARADGGGLRSEHQGRWNNDSEEQR